MSEIWAKSNKSGNGTTPIKLHEHVKNGLDVFRSLKKYIKDYCIRNLIEIAIVCHDFGKVLPAFQIRTLNNKNYEPCYPYYNVPHSLFSVLWINPDRLCSYVEHQEDYFHFILSAVAYHHWREKFAELLGQRNSEIGVLCHELENKGYIDKLGNNLIEEIKKLGKDWETLVNFNQEMARGLQNGIPFVEYVKPPYQLYYLPKRMFIEDNKLRDWILISGFLMRSDHFASFCEEENEKYLPENPNIAYDEIKGNIKAKIEGKTGKIDENNIWQFVKIKNLKDKNVILVAPTGYGKTEFSFLWSNGEKFFYTLPIRTAVNQIFERARSIFNKDQYHEKVGLLHSDADVYLLGDGGEAQSSLKSYDLARQLAYPVLISTGDQFFPYALRPPGYEKIYATFSYSRLVIDEVQAYDPRAVAIIVKFIEDVVRMGGKFLLMTATLPKFVKDEVDRVIGQQNYDLLNVYQEKEGEFKKLKKHRIKVELIENKKVDFTVTEDKLKEVLETAQEGKRVLVIANTVRQAQDIFDKLKTLTGKNSSWSALRDKIWLLHSRFTQADRSKIETKICGDKDGEIVGEFKNPKPNNENEGKILVATQVVEASLDIDADVLFTEIAPLDALVQRMGRVWRRYGPMKKTEEIPKLEVPNVYVWVFKQGLQSGHDYVYDNDLVFRTFKLLKYMSSKPPQGDDESWLENLPKAMEEKMGSGLEDVFSVQKSSQKKTRGSKRNNSNTVNSAEVATLKDFEVTLSEYDKFYLVEKLYDLPDDHGYIDKFRKTKDILDAGYMSDRLSDARKIFREIYTMSVIPSHEKNSFLNDVLEFFRDNGNKNNLYTLFKKKILTKFVVTIPFGVFLADPHSHPLDWWIRDLKDLDEGQRKRLIRWCQEIYCVSYQYNSETGLLANKI